MENSNPTLALESVVTLPKPPVLRSMASRTSGDGNASGFAWQAFVGADYYFNPKTSIFIEYKFLEYTSYRIRQQC